MNFVDNTYIYLLESVLKNPTFEPCPRHMRTKERLAFYTTVDMCEPIVTLAKRELNYRFMMAEAYWILTGSSLLSDLKPYMKVYERFSDDGIHLNGAYGPRFIQQVRYVVKALHLDQDSRQAVMTIWERNPLESKDIPCTTSLQWLIRNKTLHCVVYMRSQDSWLGWPYDVFSFSMMSLYILILLNMQGHDLKLGQLKVIAGSQHLYEEHWELASQLISTSSVRNRGIKAINTHGLIHPDTLVNALGDIRNAPSHLVTQTFETVLCAPQ